MTSEVASGSWGNCKLASVNADGYLETIDPDECWRLLAGAVVGRVSWVSSARGILTLPVSYALTEGLIVFRTAASSVLGELADAAEVAFEVDDLDPATATGWSVLVQGSSGPAPDGVARPAAWAPGERELMIAVTPSRVSGRAVSADAF